MSMIELLKDATQSVRETIRSQRENGNGFITVCENLGIDPEQLTAFVDKELEGLDDTDFQVETIAMYFALAGATLARRTIDDAAGTPSALSTDGDLDWAAIGLAVRTHPLRIRVLRCLNELGEASPSQIADKIGESVSNVSYHVNILKAADLIKLSREVPRRSATEHFYVLSTPALKKGSNAQDQ